LSPTFLAKVPQIEVRKNIRIIVIVFGTLLVAMWAGVVVSINTAREEAIADASDEAKNLAAAFADEVTHNLDGIATEMEVVAERMRAGSDLQGIFHEIPLEQLGAIQGIVINPDGMLAVTTIDANPKPLDLNDREHFRIHLDGRFKGIFISTPVTGRVSKQVTIQVSRRVDAGDGRFLGVIVFSLLPAHLTRLHLAIDLGENGVLSLAGLDNIVRARFTREHADGLAGVGQSIGGGPRPAVIPENGGGSFIRQSVIDQVTRLYSYRRVSKYPLVVTIGLDLDRELAASRSHATTIAAMALGATLLLTGLAAYLIREIRLRAAHEIRLSSANLALDGERTKLRETNIKLDSERIGLQEANIALNASRERAECASLAKSQFLANMSHELRTPLNAILGFSEMLTAGIKGPLNSPQQGYVENIHEGGEFLLRVINDVLDLARIDAGTLQLSEDEGVDLGRIATTCIVLVRQRANVGGVRLSLEIDDQVPLIVADPTRVTQIMLNLVSNAVKFTDPGGSVILAIIRAENGGVELRVRDTGNGMTAAEIEVALEIFGQVDGGLDRRHNGTGLGLPLARLLTEAHGGSLVVDSEKGRGTTITVALPAARVLTDTAISAVVETS
jgi:signal transduction histidine kinase